MSELEQNIVYLPRNQHASYFQEVAVLLTLSTDQFQVANDLTQRLFFQHGATYQSVALSNAKEMPQTSLLTNEAAGQAFVLLLIATGGSGYYQQARAEVDRQLRLVDGLIKPGGDKTLIGSLVENYAPALDIANSAEIIN